MRSSVAVTSEFGRDTEDGRETRRDGGEEGQKRRQTVRVGSGGASVLKKIDVAPRCCREVQCCSAFFDDLAR